MIITFSPAEGETRSYDFHPTKLMSVEAEQVEAKTGQPYEQAVQALVSGSARARRALLWVLEKRTHPTLRFEDLDYPYGAVEVSYDQTELDGIIEATKTAPGLTDDARAAAIAALTQLRETAPQAPKAPEPSAAPATS